MSVSPSLLPFCYDMTANIWLFAWSNIWPSTCCQKGFSRQPPFSVKYPSKAACRNGAFTGHTDSQPTVIQTGQIEGQYFTWLKLNCSNSLGKPLWKKASLLRPKRLDPPPLYLWTCLKNFFGLISSRQKLLKKFGHILKGSRGLFPLSLKMSELKRKKVPQKFWNLLPPTFLGNCPNLSWQKVPQKLWIWLVET